MTPTKKTPDLDDMMEKAGQEALQETDPEEEKHVQGLISRVREQFARPLVVGGLLSLTMMGGMVGSSKALQEEADRSLQRVQEMVGMEVTPSQEDITKVPIYYEVGQWEDKERLKALLDELTEKSPTADMYLESIREHSGQWLTIQTKEYGINHSQATVEHTTPEQREKSSGMAYYEPMLDASTIVVDLKTFEQKYQQARERFPEYADELAELEDKTIQQILGHELGHALSQTVTDGEHQCPDPGEGRGECALRREAQIAQEIGLAPKPTYGVPDPIEELAMSYLHNGQIDDYNDLVRTANSRKEGSAEDWFDVRYYLAETVEVGPNGGFLSREHQLEEKHGTELVDLSASHKQAAVEQETTSEASPRTR